MSNVQHAMGIFNTILAFAANNSDSNICFVLENLRAEEKGILTFFIALYIISISMLSPQSSSIWDWMI